MLANAFEDWMVFTGDVYLNETVRIDGIVTPTLTLIKSGLSFAKWVTKSIQMDVSAQFVNDEIGTICIDKDLIDFDFTVNHEIHIGSIIYHIEGVGDNDAGAIQGFEDVLFLTYRKERK